LLMGSTWGRSVDIVIKEKFGLLWSNFPNNWFANPMPPVFFSPSSGFVPPSSLFQDLKCFDYMVPFIYQVTILSRNTKQCICITYYYFYSLVDIDKWPQFPCNLAVEYVE
jgi:hypothetical protein